MQDPPQEAPEVGPDSETAPGEAPHLHSAFTAPDSFHIEHIPSPSHPDGGQLELFALSYRLGDSDRELTFEADNADDVDILTDGTSAFVLVTNLRRGTIGLVVFEGQEQTAGVQIEGPDATLLLGDDVWSLAPEKMLERMTARGMLSGDARSPAVEQRLDTLVPEDTAIVRDEVRDLLTVVLEPLPETPPQWDPLRVWSESGFRLDLFETGKTDRDGKSVLAYRLFDQEHGRRPVFERADFHCSPLHAVDSDRTVASLLGFLSLRPGDTDREHFEHYTPRQLDWCQRRGEELSMLAHELEQTYRLLRSATIGHESWEEAAHAGRYNRALTLDYAIEDQEYQATLNGGESDTIDVLTDGDDVYVITTNPGLGYVGLEVFSEGALAHDVFIDGSEVEACLGEDVWDLEPQDQLERLIDYLPDRAAPAPSPTRERFPTERERIEQVLADLDGHVRERIRTFLRVGRQNSWIRQAWDPPFNELSFHICKDVDELATFILRGNWSLGQAFVFGDICFINQVDGGDEWLTIKGSTAFESITMRTFSESRGGASTRLRETVERIRAASEEQCRRLEY